MGLQATFVLYLVIGVGVEAALVTTRDDPPVARWFTTLTGILFWPLYVPILLTPQDRTSELAQRRDEASLASEILNQRSDAEDAERTASESDHIDACRALDRTADNRT